MRWKAHWLAVEGIQPLTKENPISQISKFDVGTASNARSSYLFPLALQTTRLPRLRPHPSNRPPREEQLRESSRWPDRISLKNFNYSSVDSQKVSYQTQRSPRYQLSRQRRARKSLHHPLDLHDPQLEARIKSHYRNQRGSAAHRSQPCPWTLHCRTWFPTWSDG